MSKRYIFTIQIFFTLLITSGCVDSYNPPVEFIMSDILVVDGGIVDGGETVIRLSRSVSVGAENTDNPEKGAEITIISKDQSFRLDCPEDAPGVYRATTPQLNEKMQYCVNIKTGSEEYQSEFVFPIRTPEIDDVTWRKEKPGEPIKVYVNTHDEEKPVGYYRWRFEETWEFHSNFFTNAYYRPDKDLIVLMDTLVPPVMTPENYYCWNSDVSKKILISNTRKLGENRIFEMELTALSPHSRKAMYLYSILVFQNALSERAYDYYENIRKNTEETNGIFTPIPSEMKGNIHCLSNPDIPVIGFVEVANVEQKRIFIECWSLFEGFDNQNCDMKKIMPNLVFMIPEYYNMGYPLFAVSKEEGRNEIVIFYYLVAKKECTDCRVLGHKNRPDYWPNNHE